ncbi:MAG: FliM/FliN family flagellar motor C-terminal domain-containing protein [Terracidiphilus sp.]|jgi:flagellar motor switch protein FliM
MASVHPLPPQVSAPPHPPNLPGGAESTAATALVASPQLPEEAQIKLTSAVGRLPVELEVAVPVRNFRVRNLLVLEPGQVIETQWAQGADMPLATGDVQLAWSEFEVVDTQLAVRVTRLV